jgi:hypothetical protein
MSTNPAGGFLGLPGLGPLEEQTSRKFLTDNNHIVRRGAKLDAATDDVENVGKEHQVRAGMLVVQVLSGVNAGKYVDVTHANAPAAGTIEEVGILMESVNMRNKAGDREDKACSVVIHGFVRESQLLFGTADVGLIDEMKAALPLIMFEADVPQP